LIVAKPFVVLLSVVLMNVVAPQNLFDWIRADYDIISHLLPSEAFQIYLFFDETINERHFPNESCRLTINELILLKLKIKNKTNKVFENDFFQMSNWDRHR
jgi:hypothetical protein